MDERPEGSPDAAAASLATGAATEIRIHQALRRIIRALEIHSHRLSAAYTVTAQQLFCLATIAAAEPITASNVARHVHLSSSTLVGILDRLEDKGLIRRERGRADRRLVHVTVTDRGRELVRRAPSPLQDRLLAALRGLPPEDQETMAASLERIVDLMEAPPP